ncbi:hypothetical protein [Nonomuraea jabiensis]
MAAQKKTPAKPAANASKAAQKAKPGSAPNGEVPPQRAHRARNARKEK